MIKNVGFYIGIRLLHITLVSCDGWMVQRFYNDIYGFTFTIPGLKIVIIDVLAFCLAEDVLGKLSILLNPHYRLFEHFGLIFVSIVCVLCT